MPAPGADRLPVDALLVHGDRAMILAQRLTQWVAHAPDIEEDMALANLGLDLLGQARALYTLAGRREGADRTEDDLAFRREPAQFRHPLLVEQPNGDFAHTVVRQFLHDAFAIEAWTRLAGSADTEVAQLAAKVLKETTYHLRYSRGWLVRLGDGTDESHRRMVTALDALWPLVDDLVRSAVGVDDPGGLRDAFDRRVAEALSEATLPVPDDGRLATAVDRPTPELVDLLSEMQELHRAHPGARW